MIMEIEEMWKLGGVASLILGLSGLAIGAFTDTPSYLIEGAIGVTFGVIAIFTSPFQRE